MPCETCHAQFTLFKHKKSCSECRRLFCLNCLEKTRKRSLCSRCVIFNKRPLSRIELQRLKAKDLIVYLQSKHIPTAGCVEKDDLINLVVAHVDSLTGGPSPTSNSSSSIPSPGSQFESFRSIFTNLTSQQQQQQQFQAGGPPPQHPNYRTDAPRRPPPPERQSSRDAFASSGENAINFLRQGCQVFLDNVSEKLATNFKFDPSQASSASRNSSSPSSATSPSTSRQHAPPPPYSPPSRQMHHPQQSNSQRSNSHPQERVNSQQASRPKPRVPLDTLRGAESGCECSDDEESKAQRTLSQSTSNLLDDPPDEEAALIAVPGTSGCRPGRSEPSRVPIVRSKGSTLSDSSEFSSFEELNLAVESRLIKGETPGSPEECDPVLNEATTIRKELPDFAVNNASRRLITRRHSDGFINRGCAPGEETKGPHQQQHKCCSRCGLKKNELRRRLRRFHEQLTLLSTQDVEVRRHLEAILSYLERKRTSVVSNGDSNAEEVSEAPVIVNQPMPRQESDVPPPPVISEADPEPPPEKVIYKRRFVQLDEIKSSADLEELSVKQLKEILVLNRVDFKGCCEKKELIERVRRLLDDYHACPAIDKLPSDDLCKICMDAPIECVILECGHMATCTSCGKVLSECPICRQFIIRVVRFFRA